MSVALSSHVNSLKGLLIDCKDSASKARHRLTDERLTTRSSATIFLFVPAKPSDSTYGMFQDAPDHNTFEELEDMAQNRRFWRSLVVAI